MPASAVCLTVLPVAAAGAALLLRGGGHLGGGLAAVALTAVLVLVGLRRVEPLERPAAFAPTPAPFDWQGWLCLALAVAAAVAAWPLCAENRFTLPGVLLLAVAVATAALAGGRDDDGRRAAVRGPSHDLLPPLARRSALLAVVAVAAAFRLVALDTLPADMFNDITHIYQETARVLEGRWMVYGTHYPGREPLLFYLDAGVALVRGLDFYTLKLTTALVGTATVPVVYLLGREAFDDAVGLAAALFLAGSRWHVLISRVGFRGILTPLLAALVLLFLLRGLRRGSRADLLWAGAWTGLSLYTYTAALAIPAAVVGGLAVWTAAGADRGRRWRELWCLRRPLLQAAMVALLVALPMLRFMLVDGRDAFWFRPLTRVAERERPIAAPVWRILAGNAVRAGGMLHVRGDVVSRVNVPFEPHLDLVAGALFLVGLPLLFVRIGHGGNAVILVFLAALLLPSALSLAFPNEVPGAVRAGGVLAVVPLVPAAGLVAWCRRAAPRRHAETWAVALLLTGVASGLVNARSVFVDYPGHLPYGNYPLFREIAAAIDDHGRRGPVLLKAVPHWDDRDAIRLQTERHQDWGLDDEVIADVDEATLRRWSGGTLTVIVNVGRDRAALTELQSRHPAGATRLYRDHAGVARFATFSFQPAPVTPARASSDRVQDAVAGGRIGAGNGREPGP